MKMRAANPSDASEMSEVLQELIAAGKRDNSGDRAFVSSHYIAHPDRLECFLAVGEGGEILGFQSLKRARIGNPYGTPIGWGIIGTHIRPSRARNGAGSRLFASTLAVARLAGLPAIEAYIGRTNAAALAYYQAIGFQTHRETEDAICMCFPLEGGAFQNADEPSRELRARARK